MPRKIRELKRLLLKAGFLCKNIRGSHAKWVHPGLSQTIIMAGKDSSDAKPYQEKQISEAIEELRKTEGGRKK